jgi:hypothetical protein
VQDLSSSSPEVARFTRRVAFHEEPAVVAELERLAAAWGHSTASELRSAVRYWLEQHASNGDEQGAD